MNICKILYISANIITKISQKQVDILISKNQALQILYLKHKKLHKLPWIEPTKI